MFHTIIIVGNVGRDPEMRYTPSGQAVTSFSVATNRSWTGSDGVKNEETIWFKVSAWGKQAETCSQFLKKGHKVLIEGRLQPDKESGGPRIWQDKDGKSRASYEVTAQTVRFMTPRGSEAEPVTDEGAALTGANLEEDNIPF